VKNAREIEFIDKENQSDDHVCYVSCEVIEGQNTSRANFVANRLRRFLDALC
jgi:hypothetical protein